MRNLILGSPLAERIDREQNASGHRFNDSQQPNIRGGALINSR